MVLVQGVFPVAGVTDTTTWNTLFPELQASILMHLSLQDLGRAVWLGKAFRSAFQLRRSQVEKQLMLAGSAHYRDTILDVVPQVLRRCFQGVDLQTGRKELQAGESVTIGACGTIVKGWASGSDPLAVVWLSPDSPCKKDGGEWENLDLNLTAPREGHWVANLALARPCGLSPGNAHIDAATVYAILPDPSDASEGPYEYLGAMFSLLDAAGSMWVENPRAPQVDPDAVPVSATSSACGIHVQPPQDDPAKPQAVQAEHRAPSGASPAAFNQPPQGDACQAVLRQPSGGDASQTTVQVPSPGNVAGALRRVSLEWVPARRLHLISSEMVDGAIATALKMAARLQSRCCHVNIGHCLHVRACQVKGDSFQHWNP